jgi:hypothetical protein
MANISTSHSMMCAGRLPSSTRSMCCTPEGERGGRGHGPSAAGTAGGPAGAKQRPDAAPCLPRPLPSPTAAEVSAAPLPPSSAAQVPPAPRPQQPRGPGCAAARAHLPCCCLWSARPSRADSAHCRTAA